MARFLKRLACFLAIQCVIVGVIVKYGAPSNSYLGAINDKLQLLETTESPRILLVGGSNVAFGINSALVQEQTGFHPVNLGLHIGLGLEAQLRLTEENVRAGDVIVLMLEYELLNSALMDGRAETIASFVEVFPEGKQYFKSTSTSGRWKDFLDRDALRTAQCWFARARRRIFSSHRVYWRSGFNRFGDMVAHHNRKGTSIRTDPLPNTSPQHLKRAIQLLEKFSLACREKNAQVYLSFPPFPEPAFQQSRQVIDELLVALETSLEIPIINRPDDLAFLLDHFFYTKYHLNRVAADRRSHVLAVSLMQQRVTVANASDAATAPKQGTR